MYIFVTPTKKTPDSGNIPYQQCIIYLQSKCKISVKSAKTNNSCSNFCEVTPEHFSFRSLVSDVIHKNLKLMCFEVTSHKRFMLYISYCYCFSSKRINV